ncbi:M28 family peptidase [Flagellimonas myxillae]|uniref:M28 family peptidase n=1 Tax=Flagellimonas myxillae TaxID=2942214 RepID=UPI00201F8535|nr:M28 family peptidase [Muricauda myxillae]MCL6266148.1 M28 family peptidase [Muricauda myxillae]
MRFILLLLIGLQFSCNTSQKTVEKTTTATKNPDPVTYAESITEEDLKEHLYVYASDEFEGRETGKPGQKKAVAYLTSYYESLGIPAAKRDGDYQQKVPLEIAQVPEGNVDFNGSSFALGDNVLTFAEATGTYEDLVYVGYGIEEGSYSDYSNVDVSGKLVLIKAGEPVNADGNYVLSGDKKKSIWSNMSEGVGKKSTLAIEKGAKGVLYYDMTNFKRFKGYFDFMKSNKSGKMSLKDESDSQILIMLDEKSVAALKTDIESDHTPKAIPASIQLNVTSKNGEVDSENVAAIIKGTEKPDEYVVVSSHLDHIGVTADGQINNGADDDGSGTVALLEMAEAFKKAADAGEGPKRSIVFLHVTGEEKGLLGSKYYTDVDPILPLEQTVANLNIDMIGRIDPKRDGSRNYLYLIGSDKLSTELHNLSEEINDKYTQIEFDYTYNDENDPNRFYYRSDHYNFAKNNIPIIFYFNGTHADYHRPGDTPDKINYDLLKNRTRLVFYTAWEVANRENRIVVDKAVK